MCREHVLLRYKKIQGIFEKSFAGGTPLQTQVSLDSKAECCNDSLSSPLEAHEHGIAPRSQSRPKVCYVETCSRQILICMPLCSQFARVDVGTEAAGIVMAERFRKGNGVRTFNTDLYIIERLLPARSISA